MVGFPKYLNSKADYEFVIANFPPEQWKPEIQKLLDNRHAWYPVQELGETETGITDDTHKMETIEGNKWQYERRTNPTARYKQLGYTVTELEALIAQ